jgi:hypothetical protein
LAARRRRQPLHRRNHRLRDYAWIVVALLVPVALLNYLDRQMLAAMKFSLMQDIPDIGSEANWGKILALFKWTYAILSPIGGYLADRFSRRHVIAGSLFVWSAITWATGHVTTYEQLLWTRAVMGISEAFYIPAALALIADFHRGPTRPRRRLAPDGHLHRRHHRRLQRLRRRPPGLRLALACSSLRPHRHALRHPRSSFGPQRAHAPPKLVRSAPPPLGALRELLSNRSFILLVLYFTLPALAGWVVRDWMPAILKTEFGIGQGKAGVSATLYWQVAAIVAALAGGWLADRWMRGNRAAASTSAPSAWRSSSRDVRRRLFAANRAARGHRVPHPVRPRLGLLRYEQHADPLPDRPARAPRHRLRPDEPGQHQLRRLRRLGLRRPARPAGAAARHFRRLRQRRSALRCAGAPDSAGRLHLGRLLSAALVLP